MHESGRHGPGTFDSAARRLLGGVALLALAGAAPALAGMPQAGGVPVPAERPLVREVQAEAPAAGGEVKASNLKAAIAAIKERLAEKQEQRAGNSGTDALAVELRTARETIADLTEAMNRLRQERDAAMADLDIARASIEGEAMKAAEREQALSSSRQMVTELRLALQTVTAEREQAQASAAALETKIAAGREESERLAAALAEAREAGETLRSDLAAKLAESEAALAEAEARLAERTRALESAGKVAQELEASLAARTSELEESRTALADAETRLAALGTELAAAREKLVAQADGEKALRDELAALASENAELQQVAASAVDDVEEMGESLPAALKENEDLVAALGELRASQALLSGELEAARKDAATAADEVARLRALQVAQDGGEDGIGRDELARRLAAAEDEITRLTEELVARDQHLADAAAAGDAEALTTRISLLERDLRRSEEARRELEQALNDRAGAVEPAAGPVAGAAQGAGEPGGQAILASTGPANDEDIQRYLADLNAVETPSGWLMTMADGIVFAPGSDSLAEEARPALAKIAALISYYDDAEIRIVGHTDSFGDAEVNRQLSLRRANSVRDYLSDNFGIAPERIVSEGRGEAEPIAGNETIAGRRANRRVEVYLQR